MTDITQIKFRIPVEMRADIEAAAKLNCRSINGEILYRLASYQQPIDNARQSLRKLGEQPHNLIAEAIAEQMR